MENSNTNQATAKESIVTTTQINNLLAILMKEDELSAVFQIFNFIQEIDKLDLEIFC